MPRGGRKAKYVVGYRRHKLEIMAIDPGGTQKHPRYQLRCDCGNQYVATASSFLAAKGCRKCHIKPNRRKYGAHRVMQGQRLYRIWASMKHRCRPDSKKNDRYGARGIRVCREWDESYAAFEAWALANGYAENLTIDRIDNDGNYESVNCEWVTKEENSRRCRALYDFVQPKNIVQRIVFYDEPSFGDF